MRKTILILKWVFSTLLLLVLLIFTNRMQLQQKIKLDKIQIKESIDSFINNEIILNYLKEKSINFDNQLIANFDKQNLEDLLQNHDAVKLVEVFTNQKGEISIYLEQKKAIVRVISKTGDYYLDEQGGKMRFSDHYTPKLLVASGEIDVEDHIEICSFVNLINRSEFWNAQITQIHFNNNDILLVPRVGNQRINIGSFENILDKLDNLYQFYKLAMPLKGWQKYSDINLKFHNQIVCVRN